MISKTATFQRKRGLFGRQWSNVSQIHDSRAWSYHCFKEDSIAILTMELIERSTPLNIVEEFELFDLKWNWENVRKINVITWKYQNVFEEVTLKRYYYFYWLWNYIFLNTRFRVRIENPFGFRRTTFSNHFNECIKCLSCRKIWYI